MIFCTGLIICTLLINLQGGCFGSIVLHFTFEMPSITNLISLKILGNLLLLFCLLLVSNFVIMLHLELLKLKAYTVTTSLCLSISSFEFCQFSSLLCAMLYTRLTICVACMPGFGAFSAFLHMLLKWLTLLQLPHLPYARHCLHWCNIL